MSYNNNTLKNMYKELFKQIITEHKLYICMSNALYRKKILLLFFNNMSRETFEEPLIVRQP